MSRTSCCPRQSGTRAGHPASPLVSHRLQFAHDLWETREERDSNYDGKVDYWEYFEGGKLDRAGTDKDGDGNVDEWLQVGDG